MKQILPSLIKKINNKHIHKGLPLIICALLISISGISQDISASLFAGTAPQSPLCEGDAFQVDVLYNNPTNSTYEAVLNLRDGAAMPIATGTPTINIPANSISLISFAGTIPNDGSVAESATYQFDLFFNRTFTGPAPAGQMDYTITIINPFTINAAELITPNDPVPNIDAPMDIICAGDTITVNFQEKCLRNKAGFDANTGEGTVVVLMSDDDFATSTVLTPVAGGTFTSDGTMLTDRSLTIPIPIGTPNGANYKFKVITENASGFESTVDVNLTTAYTVRQPILEIDDMPAGPFCSSDQFDITINTRCLVGAPDFSGSNSGQIEILMSDENGMFSPGVVVGSDMITTGLNDGQEMVQVTIPDTITEGTGYRFLVRTVGSDNFSTDPPNGFGPRSIFSPMLTTQELNPNDDVYCAGDMVQVPYTARCLRTPQGFSAPSGTWQGDLQVRIISTLQGVDRVISTGNNITINDANPVNGNITVTIPNDVRSASDYRFFVETSNGFRTDDEGNGSDKTISSLRIITPMALASPLCQGDNINITYTSGDDYSAGVFIRAQLSDAAGNFGPNPTVIGQTYTTAAAGTMGNMTAAIPLYATHGTGYRMRLFAGDPPLGTVSCETIGDFTITQIFPFVNPEDDPQCLGGNAQFTASASTAGGVATYQWESVCTDTFITASTGLNIPAINDVWAIDNMNIIVATADGLARSSDGGATFTLYNGLNSGNISHISVGGGFLYATQDGKLERKLGTVTTGGFTILNIPGVSTINDVLVDGSNVYVAAIEGLFLSTDDGNSWTKIFMPMAAGVAVNAVALDGNGGTYAGTSAGLFVARNGTTNFAEMYTAGNTANNGNNGLLNANITDVVIQDGVIYLGTFAGVAISTDNGFSFHTTVDGLEDQRIIKLAVHEGKLFASTIDGLAVDNVDARKFTLYKGSDGLGGDVVNGFVVTGTNASRMLFLGTQNGLTRTNMTTMAIGPPSTMLQINNINYADHYGCRYQLRATKGACTFRSSMATFGRIPPQITAEIVNGPTQCEGSDGEVLIRGMYPFQAYTLERLGATADIGDPKSGTVNADSAGVVRLLSLSAGEYRLQIRGQEGPPPGFCTSNELTFELMDPPPPKDVLVTGGTLQACLGDNIEIILDDIGDTLVYQAFQDLNMTMPSDPSNVFSDGANDVSFIPTTTPTSSGSVFFRIFEPQTRCYGDTLEVGYTIYETPVITVAKVNPGVVSGQDGESNGSITINGLVADSTYNIFYTPQGGSEITAATGFTGQTSFTIMNLPAGVYTNIRVELATTPICDSNPVAFCPLFDPSELIPPDEPLPILAQTCLEAPGASGGYLQYTNSASSCTGGDQLVNDGNGIAVGRVRGAQATDLTDQIEMRGYIQFDFSSIPAGAIIDQIEYLPVTINTTNQMLCEINLQSATDDLQFDVVDIEDDNYMMVNNLTDELFQDYGEVKYADFTISKEATGAWLDLGPRAAADLQRRLTGDKIFQIGLRLSGNDFDVALYQFYGLIFAGHASHRIRVKYHQEDYGDLPLPYATTSEGSTLGPSHRIDEVDIDVDPNVINLQRAMFIGATPPDADIDGQPSALANGDDTPNDDEDLSAANLSNPLTNNKLVAGDTALFTIPMINNLPGVDANLTVFFDWNGDGIFANDVVERYTQSVPTGDYQAAGNERTFTINIPTDAINGMVGVRVRLTSADVDAYGPAPNGEVEDFFVRAFSYDFGDLPDLTNGTAVGDYHTIYTVDGLRGPRHEIDPNLSIGNIVDAEGNGQPEARSLGDDIGGLDDEDGITAPALIIRDQQTTFLVDVKNQTTAPAYLVGYADWNNDGDFDDTDEATAPITIAAGTNEQESVTFNVPPNPVPLPEQVAIRFRLGDNLTLVQSATGPADRDNANADIVLKGEVEDLITNIAGFDWGDLPEPKYITNAAGGQQGPSHRIANVSNTPAPGLISLFLGATPPDAEMDGLPSPDALGDDLVSGMPGDANERRDDEDLSQADFTSTQFTSNLLVAGDNVTFTVPVTNNLSVNANVLVFIDWNDDGIFENITEAYIETAPPGTNNVIFNVMIPGTTPTTDQLGVRVRLTTADDLDAYGPAPDGEVEDFFIAVTQYDYADLPDDPASPTLTAMGNYLTTYNENGLEGPRHQVNQNLRIGNLVDAEGNGSPQINAFGDDVTGVDDEEGIITPATIIRDQPAVFQVFVTNETNEPAYLQGFVDWDDDGDFEDDPAFSKAPLVTVPANSSGYYDVTFTVPTVPVPLPDRVAARFRLSNEDQLVQNSFGPAINNDIFGEVHDLYVNIAGFDWGDLPEPLYITDAQGGQPGPSHKIVSADGTTNTTALYIGSSPASAPDAEQEGQPNNLATGDDNIANTGEPNEERDDEELSQTNWTSAFTNNSLIAGASVNFSVPITNNYTDSRTYNVYTFIDWNRDGIFENDTELYLESRNTAGINTIDFNINIPETTPTGQIAVRVRVTSQTGINAYGPADDGEVEDFFITVTQYDYADLPDADDAATVAMGNYLTIYDENGLEGPRHQIDQDLRIGNLVDAEADGRPQANAFGDDINGLDDEDLIITPDTILRDVPANFFVFVTNKTGNNAYLQGFVDWDDDGDFEDDVAFTKSGPITVPPNSSGYIRVPFMVPPMPVPLPERVAARFRLSNEDQLVQNSFGPDIDNDIFGEVHDLYVEIAGYDWGDLPEPRYITDREGGFSGPSHKIVTSGNPTNPAEQLLFIGATQPDAENEGIPSAMADGDDQAEDISGTDEITDRVDDEDLSEINFVQAGTNTPYPVTAGEPIDFQVPVTNNANQEAFLWAFIDWNGDGDFDDLEEKRFLTVPANYNANVPITFEYRTVPERNEADTIGVRVRLTTGEIFDAYGPAPDGEVEDFLIELRGADYGDLPDITLQTGQNDFRTLRAQDGPRHAMPVVPLVYLGELIDSEADGQPTEDSDGDDEDMIEGDEDGIIFLTPLNPGNTSQIAFSGTNNSTNTATLYMFADWENDGIMVPVPLTLNTIAPGSTVEGQIASFDVPTTATFEQGRAYFRFRLTTDPDFTGSDLGFALDGEVEDYFVPVFSVGNLVWEDRNNNGLQDAEEIDLGIEGVRVVVRFGGIDPLDGTYDEVNENTIKNPAVTELTKNPADPDAITDYVLQTFTVENGLYRFDGLIEGRYQVIAVDTFNLTPTRPDWIDNVTEEDRDSDGYPLKEPWEYEDFPGNAYTAVDPTVDPADPMPFDVRQSKTQLFTMLRDSVGTDEEGILDQQNPRLLDPNQLVALPDNRVEQRIDFGYTAFDFGDLREDENDPNLGFITTENETIDEAITVGGLFPLDTVLAANLLEGPKHIVTPEVYLGECADAETEGNPDFDAGAEFAVEEGTVLAPNPKTGDAVPDGLGDDPNDSGWNTTDRQDTLSCTDDENGIHFMTPLVPGYEAMIDVRFFATINDDGPDAFLQAYFDWNGDDDFYVDGDPNLGFDPNEHIVFTQLNGDTLFLEPNTLAVELEMSDYIGNDSIRLMFNVPEDAKMNDGTILARFRIGRDPNMAATGILPGNLNFDDGIVPEGEVEDYFMKLAKVGNLVWEDRDYDGIQDLDEPVIPGVEITLDFDSGFPGDDPFAKQYTTVTDENGKYYFCGLIGNIDPSGLQPVYTLTAADPDNMTPTVNRDTFPAGGLSNCVTYNSDGNDNNIDDRTTSIVFRIENPMDLCTGEADPLGKNDMTQVLIMDMDGIPDNFSQEDNVWPDCQIDETLDFGYVGFDYGDLPDSTIIDTIIAYIEGEEMIIDTFMVTDTIVQFLAVSDTVLQIIDGNAIRQIAVQDTVLPFNLVQERQVIDTTIIKVAVPDTTFVPIGPDAVYEFLTLRDWLPGDPNVFGPRHAIQPRLYLGGGVDAELNGQPDLDAGSKAGGDDDFRGEDPTPFEKGLANDDETGIRLLTPLLPGEYAFIRVDYTSQDTVLAGGYEDRLAILNGFIDWNGDGDFYDGGTIDVGEAIEFTHESFTNLNDVTAIASTDPDPTDGLLPGGVDQYKIFGFRVPDTSITKFNDGRAFMRFRLSWTGNLDPDNRRYHKAMSAHVILDNEPAAPIDNQIEALSWTWADTLQTYPQGEVEDYAIPLAKVGNLAWYDHNVNGRQDDPLQELYNTYRDEYGVDTLHLVLIWGGIDDETGNFDEVGYQDANCETAGDILDIKYNLSIAPPAINEYAPDDILKTDVNGLYSFQGLIPGTYNLIPLKYLQEDSTDFVNFWPKHRVLTIKNNVGVTDSLDSDAGPGAVFTIHDGNDREPEVCVDSLPLLENGQQDIGFPVAGVEDQNDPFFPDIQYDQTIDFGWVDEPNIEASLDLVGVDFPTSGDCDNFNVIFHLCLKNPQETPLDSIVPFLNIAKGYGDAFVRESTPEISIVENAFLTKAEADSRGLNNRIAHRVAQNKSSEQLTPFINPGYDGYQDTLLLTGGDFATDFFLPGDSIVCIRIEFEVNPEFYNPTNDNPCPWMIRGGAYARAIGFEYDENVEGDWTNNCEPFTGKGAKAALIDWMPKGADGLANERFGQHIQVYDLSDEYDDPWPTDMVKPGDNIRFEGFVADRGLNDVYQTFPIPPSLTGRDKYLDEDDYTIQNDECWDKTRDLSAQDNIIVSLDENCEVDLDPSFFVSNHMPECGFDRYPEGSYYRVIVQDEHTGETLWASVDREPFDASQYLDRKLIFRVRSVANSCTVVWGRLTLEDKLPPVVTCPDDIDDVNTPINAEGRFLVCTDIDSVLNNPSSYLDEDYAYFTGIATAMDNCTDDVIFDGVNDVLEVLADCDLSAANGYAYARITRTFFFKDRYDNRAQCEQTIYFYRPQIVLPDCEVYLDRYAVGDDRNLTPADLINQYNSPEAVPYVINAAGDRIYLTEESVCGFGLNWRNENEFVSDECGLKIIRRWRILDWCNNSASDYPQYLIDPILDDGCHDDLTWTSNGYEFEQLLVIDDKIVPVVTIPDLDEDGFKGQNGYKGGPQANPLNSTDTYDAEDIFIFETSGFDCAANFSVSKSMFEVEEEGAWCFDLNVVVRQPVLDLDERKTGVYEFVNDPLVQVTGDCENDYWVSGAEMKLDTTKRFFFQTRFYDECGNDTLIYVPFMVVDNVKPVVVCDDELNVTFDNFGTGRLAAVDVDEGTSDNCGKILWLKVRRPVNDCGDAYRTLLNYVDANNNSIVDEFDYIDEDDDNVADSLEFFRLNEDGELMSPLLDEVNFFCCDPDSVKVELWASDKSGNVSNCWQYARLTNRPPLSLELPGNYILPNNREINCETDEDLVVLLTNGGRYAQGSLTYNAAISILGGDLFIPLDNTCTSFTREMIVTPNFDPCGFGKVEITWILSNGGEEVITESRMISIVERHDYWIKFPKDARSNCANPNPDTLEFAENGCDLIAIAQLPDERFDTPQDENSCYKIFRTYQVINWCEYDGQSLPVIVSRDWDAFNAVDCFDTDRMDDDLDADDSIAGEYHLNPSEPDGDGIPGNSDLYVIVDIDNAGDGLATVYYDNNNNPNDTSTDDEDTDLVEGYWWAVTREGVSCDDNVSAWFDADDDGQTDANGNGFDIDGTDTQDDSDNRYGSFGFWQYTQHIVVYDEIDPELTVISQDTFFSVDAAECGALVQLDITAEDVCDGISTNLETRVIIDREEVSVGTGSLSYEGSYTLGTHSLIVTTRDACGNTAVFNQDFVVADGKAPAPIVHEDAIVELGRTGNGTAEGRIWATDLVASPIYDCTGQDASEVDANGNPLITKYSINIVGDSVDMNQVGLLFTCEDANNSIEVEIHAWDEAGNHDFVITSILVQNNSGACDIGAGEGQISGEIATYDNQRVNEVEVRLSGGEQRSYMTNATGTYVFDQLVEGADFTVIPNKDDFHSNGLTTFDVILLQRHLIGSSTITNPYLLIAADINKSGTISTLDLIQLRKMILGIDERFANNTSWRFVDAAYRFTNSSNPLGEIFPEVRNINNLDGTEDASFVAIKIGDMNGSAAAFVQPRSNARFEVEARATDRLLAAGQAYQIDFTASGLEAIQGYQFSMQLGAGVELLDMIYGEAQAEHFGVFSNEGVITTSWNGKAGSEMMFSLVLRPKQDIALGDAIQLSNRYTPGEAYQEDSEAIMDVVLRVAASAEDLIGNALYQNRPNPFMAETQIRFELGQAERASLQIRDVTGRLVKLIEGDYEAGIHEVRIKHRELPAAGVYYYTLQAGDFTATKKMILIDQ